MGPLGRLLGPSATSLVAFFALRGVSCTHLGAPEGLLTHFEIHFGSLCPFLGALGGDYERMWVPSRRFLGVILERAVQFPHVSYRTIA